MNKSLLLSLQLMPTAMVGLGKRGSAIVDRFFELLPPSLRHLNLLQAITPAVNSKISEPDRPKGGEALLLHAIERAIRLSKTSDDNGDLGSLENHRFSSNPSTYRALVVASPFEELTSQLLTVCNKIEEAAARMGTSELAIDVLLLAEFSPGPAAQRRAKQGLGDLSAHVKKQQSQAKVTGWRPRYNFIWLDHTNERGVSLKKEIDTYDDNACRVIELLLSTGRDLAIKQSAKSAAIEVGDDWLLTASSIGVSALEVPLESIAVIGIARELSKIYYSTADIDVDEPSQELMSTIEQSAGLTAEIAESPLAPNEAASSAERIAKQLARLPSTHFLLGGEPSPELTTLRAGLERLLLEASHQTDSGGAANQLAKRKGALIKKIVEAHLNKSASGLSEAEITMRHLISNWPDRLRAARNEIEQLEHLIEQRGRKIAWLSDETEKRSQRLGWRRPMVSVIFKASMIAIPLSAVAAFAAFSLPGLSNVPVGIIGSTAAASFITSIALFLFKYLQDRSVIPEFLHELGDNALRRIELIELKEHYQFLVRLFEELGQSLGSFKKYRDLLRNTSTDLAQLAIKELQSLSSADSYVFKASPNDEGVIAELIGRHMGNDKFLSRLKEMNKRMPRTPGDVAEYTDKAMAWGVSEALPFLFAEEELQPGNQLAGASQSVNGWGDLILMTMAAGSPWFRGFSLDATKEGVPDSFTLAYDGATSIVERRTVIAVCQHESRDLRRAASNAGAIVYDGITSHAIAVFTVVSGIPIGMISNPHKIEAGAAR